jgi:hypothetical protein
MNAVIGTLLGRGAGALIGAWGGRKTAQITAENAAWMQSEKLRHDALAGEIAFKRAKLEELSQAVEHATAYCTLSVAVFRRKLAPTEQQQLDRYNEDMENIQRALRIADLYFDSVSETIAKVRGIIDRSLHTHREYFRNEPNQEPDHLSRWTREIVKLERELAEIRAELNQKIPKEASRLSMMETDVFAG